MEQEEITRFYGQEEVARYLNFSALLPDKMQ
jgi:hypothetical protein